jgi:hypothetical protein
MSYFVVFALLSDITANSRIRLRTVLVLIENLSKVDIDCKVPLCHSPVRAERRNESPQPVRLPMEYLIMAEIVTLIALALSTAPWKAKLAASSRYTSVSG